MSRLDVRTLMVALGVAIAGAGYADASAPGSKAKSQSKKNSSITVTETETEAKLAGAGTQVAAKGEAESKVITVTNTTAGTSTTNSFLTIGVKGLTLADTTTVTFQLNGASIGTGSVKRGRVAICLSSVKGNKVPAVNAGDTISVLDPDGTTVDLTGTAGAAKTETETSGK